MSLSVQLYSVRSLLEADLPGTIRRLAQVGFTQVEPYNFAATAGELGDALAANGLSAPTGHAPLLSSDQDVIFAAAKQLGITTVIEPFIPADRWQDADSIRDTARRLNLAAKKGAEYGIRVGYHNHWWELESLIEGKSALEYFASLLEPELVLEVDTYWAAVGGAEPVALLGRLGPQVVAIHIKDGPGRTDDQPVNPEGPVVTGQLPAGQGVMDVPAIMAAAKSLEVAVIEFDDYAGDIFEGMAESLRYVRTLTAADGR